jgi:hypothetical protein
MKKIILILTILLSITVIKHHPKESYEDFNKWYDKTFYEFYYQQIIKPTFPDIIFDEDDLIANRIA